MAKKVKSDAYTVEDIKAMKRSDIRYALFSAARGAETTGKNKKIIAFFDALRIKTGFEWHEFSDPKGWDISKDDVTAIVSGHIVRQYHQELTSSLFTEDGILR